ncbi:ran-specific GTPase-activating protein-like [Corticium candelabrum]|uniref:ran-specific GTPase-activating protein-like n=1 Tax=Corticium candelabrum TaxID=121492 RepID=UPI002E254F4F|nr:ran-specific GTPase-activating protein-like [Corticium candelabrum]
MRVVQRESRVSRCTLLLSVCIVSILHAMAEEQSREEVTPSNDPHFEPIIHLPEVETKTLEEDEEVVFKMRAKLFRYASDADPPEWKERGVGDVKILKHKVTGLYRLLMRREKTLKICANHYLTKQMQLKPNIGSDRAWVWHVLADFADEVPKQELLAIRFKDSENAQKFKAKFEECQTQVIDKSTENVTEKLSQLTVNKEKDESKKVELTADDNETDSAPTDETKDETKQDSQSQSKEETHGKSRSDNDVKTETEANQPSDQS